MKLISVCFLVGLLTGCSNCNIAIWRSANSNTTQDNGSTATIAPKVDGGGSVTADVSAVP